MPGSHTQRCAQGVRTRQEGRKLHRANGKPALPVGWRSRSRRRSRVIVLVATADLDGRSPASSCHWRSPQNCPVSRHFHAAVVVIGTGKSLKGRRPSLKGRLNDMRLGCQRAPVFCRPKFDIGPSGSRMFGLSRRAADRHYGRLEESASEEYCALAESINNMRRGLYGGRALRQGFRGGCGRYLGRLRAARSPDLRGLCLVAIPAGERTSL